ncbi:class I SAM-dependent methyltransferase [Nocardiopsis listeri]|uniref:class I SAM-dependent methyltransferase n=1 Tax=Nocardiopsis listeri TaxID=53440 RepID=UPI0008342CD5|nr:class I SAM-dependent methyltransferase [Nocardiopsis listeri]
MPEHDDPYDHSGQFIDPMITGWWEHHGTTVADALRDLPTDAGPVVDAGAGGGLGTRLIARTLPRAHVLAIEPSLPLRSVLLSRVFEDPHLRPRVTVDGDDLLSARLPNRLGGVVAANLIGHFSPHERDRLWEDLVARLTPGAFVLLNLPAPVEPERVGRTRMAELHIGGRHYVGWAEAEPIGTEQLSWNMTYEVYEGDRLISRDEIHYAWWTLSEQALHAEATPHGLLVVPHGPAEAGLFKVLREENHRM